MSDTLRDALKKLDPSNDSHWTADKLPAVDAVRSFLPEGETVTRAQITEAADGFNKDTAAAYWLTAPAAPAPAEPAAQAATGPSTVAAPWGAGGNEPPQPNGAGAGPQAETQAGEGAEASQAPEGGEGGEATAPGASEQSEVEGPGDVDDTDELTALEAELEETQNVLAEGRLMIDQAKAKLAEYENREAELTEQIERLRPKHNTNSDAIQGYLASQRKQLEARGARKRLIAESGLDLKELAKDLKSPLDAAMARKTGRGRPTR